MSPSATLHRWIKPAALTSALALVISLLSALGAGAQEPPPPDGALDVVFALDSSGSISQADWVTQLDGYSAALQDQSAFPTDGTIAVGVTQWSSSGTQILEIPLTLIDDPGDITSLVDQLQDLKDDKAGGGTDAQRGLEHAADVLAASGRVDPANWNVCMSTDGTGGNMTTGTNYAKNQGVDKFSVVGIDVESIRSFYEPHVFGGGTYSFARNSAEFANLIVGACVNDPVELKALEVNQAIQSWDNDVTLIEDKPTTVRAFLQTKPDEDDQRVAGRLIARRNGSELPGSPLAASNRRGDVLVQEDIVPRRGNLNDSLNFVLPPDWLSGTVEFEFDGGGTTIDCSEGIGSLTSECKTEVSFNDGVDADLKVVGIPFEDGGNTVVPSPGALLETGRRVRTTFPVSSMTITTKNQLYTTFAGNPDLDDVNNALATQRMLDGCFSFLGCDTLYYGQLKGDDGGGKARGIPSQVSSGWDYDLPGRSDTGFFRNVAPHEVGHSLGLHHSVKADKRGPCGARAGAAAPTYPWFDSVGGRDRSILHPPGASDADQNWGLDNRYVRNDVGNLAVVHPSGPRATFDMMGYCWINSPQDLWPSSHTWDLMRGTDALNPDNVTGTSFTTLDGHTTSGDHLIVSGTIDLDADTAAIDPPVFVDGELPIPEDGDYRVQLLDDEDAELEGVDFEPDVDAGRPGTLNEEDPPPSGSFTVPVPLDGVEDPVAAIAVLHDGSGEIGRITASDTAPEIDSLDSPLPESDQTGENVTFSWTAHDDDGDDLLYTVRYSQDDGVTWNTLAVHTADTSITVPRSQLAGSVFPDGSIFQVQVTDGVHVVSDTSGGFTVAGNDPVVDIASPTDGEGFYSGVQTIVLEADATDPEDGDVSDSIEWESDLDGDLGFETDGSGRLQSMNASDLREGTHVLTATATDVDENSGTDTVTIEVFRVPPPPNDPPTAGLAVDPDEGTAPLDVSFTLSGTDPEDDTLTYTLDFGDGSTPATGTLPDGPIAHTYAAGTHTATLTVDDGEFARTATVTVTVAAPDPPPAAAGPPAFCQASGGGQCTVAPGGTFATGTDATEDDPVVTTVTTPDGGTVSVTSGSGGDDTPPSGFSFFDVFVDIDAPDATAANPLVIEFRIHESVIPEGTAVGDVTVFRDGAPVGDCPGSSQADPDPCVTSRTVDGDDVVITVLTSQASLWRFGEPEDEEPFAAESACPEGAVPASGFTDVASVSVHAPAIDCLAWWGVTRGKTATTYAPLQNVTRAQMASFLVRTIEQTDAALPAGADAFGDDDGSVHEDAIDRLAAAGIVNGKAAGVYDPDGDVTRAQMASLLVRAYEHITGDFAARDRDAFDDDDGSVHEANINKAAAIGLTDGTTPDTFAPHRSVRRDDMASFLTNLLEVLVEIGAAAPPAG